MGCMATHYSLLVKYEKYKTLSIHTLRSILLQQLKKLARAFSKLAQSKFSPKSQSPTLSQNPPSVSQLVSLQNLMTSLRPNNLAWNLVQSTLVRSEFICNINTVTIGCRSTKLYYHSFLYQHSFSLENSQSRTKIVEF